MTDFADYVSSLTALRTKHGPESEIGWRCSNIIEMIGNLPRPPEEWIDYLMPDWVPETWNRLRLGIAKQVAELARLTAAAQ